MGDETILQKIQKLVDEEHTLWSEDARPAGASARLEQIRIELDQCWDLLRQRRAKREFGENPDEAQVRDARIVEGYQG